MKTIISVALISFALNANAQQKFLTDKTQTEQLSKKVAELFKANKVAESVDELNPYWPLEQNEIDAFEEKTIKYLNLINQTYGAAIGTAKVKSETIGEFAIRETYLVRFKNTALRLKFTYYKNDSGWIVNAFKWDDSFSDEFK